MDMMVMALACDLTAVGTFQWTDTEAKHTFPWLEPPRAPSLLPARRRLQGRRVREDWHVVLDDAPLPASGDGRGQDGRTATRCSTRASSSSAPRSRSPIRTAQADMPFMLAGAGGGLRGGRWVHYTDKTDNKNSHNNLLVSILNLFGDTRQDVRQRRQVRRAARQHHLS